MPSHFSAIGLPVDSHDDFVAFAEQAALTAEVFGVRAGRYLRWASPSGAELWLHLDRRGGLVSAQPHFSGPASVRVRLTGRVSQPDDTELEGSFHGWADPDSDELESGAYPFVFSAPDFQAYSDLAVPSVATVQIAAFAHEVTVYASEEAYDEAQEGEVRFASRSFFPSGTFMPLGEEGPPQPFALFTGHVIGSGAGVNELSGFPFHWATVETLGGTYDVVLDPALLGEVPPVGVVLSGSFWLSGRLTEYARSEPKGLLKRLFRN
jgi:hypothetical protein